ncbi:MAG: hypothetical protein NTX50_16670 [Candidatus Sumerlaeota bacterium]|nr:hypothetical protein [Candidatus Sumerlaeota bacterium]
MKQTAFILGIALLCAMLGGCYMQPKGEGVAKISIVADDGLKASIVRVNGKMMMKSGNDYYTFTPGTYKLGVACGKGDKAGKIRELTLEVPSAAEYNWHLTPVMDGNEISDIKCKLEKVR